MIAKLDPADPASLDAYCDLVMGLARACRNADKAGMDVTADLYLTMAACLLGQAATNLTLASLAQARGIAESPR